MIGKTLGHYQITGRLGKGGMGEVYQAKDQKLGRDVAIKVLPEEFAGDADRVARFQREAKLLASLNHPNIGAIHGLEESGGTSFLVLELVEGQTLADRIKADPIPVEESLKLALQIAEALEAAHEKGVIHRDLKPANIKVTPDGKVKVLDFGLAKAYAGEQAELNLSNSPTLSNAATQQGVILGTAAYMSPEQARGESVDKKADIWAFGCVLFEMLTGRGAFEGRTVSDVLASVIKSEPGWDRLPPNLHPRIRLLLERCLEKEPRNRCSSIGDARADIQKDLADPGGLFAGPVTTGKPQRKLRAVLPWVAAALALGAIIAGWAVWKLKPPEPKPVMRFDCELPEGQHFSDLANPALAVSPDGKQFVCSTTKGLYLRSVDQWDARLIAGSEESAQQPFFSPDGKWIGYFSTTSRKLKKIAAGGGTAIALCDVLWLLGADWHRNDMIVYGQFAGDIMRISSGGGAPESIAKGISGRRIYPQILPDGKSVLYTAATGSSTGKIMVQSPELREPKELFEAYGARYLPTGHIVYIEGNILFAVPFNPDRLEVTGAKVAVVEGLRNVAVSDSGTLVFIPGSTGAPTPRRIPVWVDRDGREEPIAAEPRYYTLPKISPDGTRLAVTVFPSKEADIYIWDIPRETMARFTFAEGEDNWPLWTPDGKRIVYRSSRDGVNYDINGKAADGTGEVEKIASWPNLPGPLTWSKDTKTLLSWDLNRSPMQSDISMLSLEGGHARVPLFHEKYNEDHPQISPDGQWLAYASNESGWSEVYVRPFPDVNKSQVKISIEGGYGPLWSPEGSELFYRNLESVLAVSVETGPVFKYGKPHVLFRGAYLSESVGAAVLPNWDIHPDGKRFLMMKEIPTAAEGPQRINVVLNWFEELKQRVPVHVQ